jgi:putative ABC transport system permease protein
MLDISSDLRDAWRALRHDRAYAAAVVATLAITLGAATAVFSIVNGVLLKPLRYPHPQALVSIREVVPASIDRYPTLPVTPRHFEVWRKSATSFTSMAQMDWRTSTLTGAGDAAQIVLLRASGTLFDVLQTPVALGRGLTWDDERAERPRVAVISDRLWRERLGGDPAVLGRSLTLGGVPHTVVGVLPRDFLLPKLQTLGESAALNSTCDVVVPFRLSLSDWDWMGEFNFGVVARLQPGVTVEQARAEMNVLQGTVAAIAARETREPAALRAWVMPLEETIAGSARRGLLLLMGAIAGVLLIACANLANLTLTRTVGRLRDAAVRGALGASRARLVRAVVVEQLLLAAVGTALALLAARAALRLFVTTAPVSIPRVQDVTVDGRVLAFAGATAVLAALSVALLPAWRLGRVALESVLRAGGRGADRGGRRARSVLLSAQVALSVVLLAVSSLFLASLARALHVDTGFQAEGAATIEVAPVASRYADTAARTRLYDRVLERVRAIPGVTAASWTSALPLTGETWVDRMARPDRAATGKDAQPSANYRFVGAGYFRAIGTPLLQGRDIEDRDRTRTLTPAVISARAARTLWPGENAVGRLFTRGDPDVRYEVIGIVPDGHVTALESEPPLMVYVPYWHYTEGKSLLVVRARADMAGVLTAARAAVHDVDPDVAIATVAPLQQVVDTAVEGRRYQAVLLTAFGGVALLIAIVGVYATTAYGISRRRREINIRVALGAQTAHVFALVLRQSAAPIGAGLAAGLLGALAAGGTVASLLFQVRPRDPATLAAVVAIVGLTGLFAAAIAARAGLRLEPAAALRDE